MKLHKLQTPRSSRLVLIVLASAPFALLASGCSKSEPVSTTPVKPVTQADMIKSVESNAQMPADVKAREIARIKAENQGTP